MKVVVVDMGVGNLRTLVSALEFLGIQPELAEGAAGLTRATHVLLPGVGAFDHAIMELRSRGMLAPLRELIGAGETPILGVCLGMQLLAEASEEGHLSGLGAIRAGVERLGGARQSGYRVPHVGFAKVYGHHRQGLFAGLGETPWFYFTHSYAIRSIPAEGNTALCDHHAPFVAGFQLGQLCGVQFHPEMSQSTGLRVLKNFLEVPGE